MQPRLGARRASMVARDHRANRTSPGASRLGLTDYKVEITMESETHGDRITEEDPLGHVFGRTIA